MISGPADPKSSQAQPSWVVGPPVAPAARLGQLLDGEFLVKGILGQGELGVTYEADNTRLKRRFAVLMLGRGLKPTHSMMLAVRDDLRRAQPLTTAGLMPVKLIADRDGIPGFATELLEGETLRGRLGRGPLRADRALALVLSVARTLEAAHKVGLIHGDLRPENIFLVRPTAKSTFAGKVMLVEHALHHLRRRAPGLDDRLPLYKLMYRPPEQVLGEAGAGEQGDVWVLGAILFECLTGKPAFYAEEPEFVLDNLGSPPPPLTENLEIGLHEHLASALNVLIASACARDLESRVLNMSELIEGLDQVIAGSAVKLPEVVVESREEAAAAPTPTTAPARRMNRLLQRLSGVFPQIQLPGPASQPPGSSAETAAVPSVAIKSGSAVAPVVVDGPISVPKVHSQPAMQPIVPPKERVSRILQKLSGAYPSLSPTSPEGVEPSTVPKGVQALPEPPKTSGPPSQPPKIGSDAPTPKTNDLDRALEILKKQRGDAAPLPAQRLSPNQATIPAPAASPAAGFRPTVPPIDPADLAPPFAPAVPVAPVAKPIEPSAKTPPLKLEAPALSTKTPPAKIEAPAVSTKTPSPKIDSAPISTKTPPISTKTPPISTKTPSPKLEPSANSAKHVVPKPEAQPGSSKTPPIKPEPAPTSTMTPAPKADPSAISTKNLAPKADPSAISAKSLPAKTEAQPASAKTPAPMEVQPPSKKSSPPPIDAQIPSVKSPLPPADAAPPSKKSPADAGTAATSNRTPPLPALGADAPTVKPRDVSISSAETPKAPLIAKPATKVLNISLDATLQPEDLAEVLDISLPGMPVPSVAATSAEKAPQEDKPAGKPEDQASQPLPALKTMSDMPTNPALASAIEKLSPLKPGTPGLTEQATQPALRRMPITEQATQARLEALPLAELATQAKLEALPLAELATQAKYTLPAESPTMDAAPNPVVAEIPTPVAPAAPPPMPAPPADRPRPPRPPRVSQLIAALQAQQGPPPEPSGVAATNDPKATGRRSPGLIGPAPDILGISSPTVSSSGTGGNDVLPVQSERVGPVSWVLRHQEAVAALIGALLVILCAFLYIFLKS